MHCIALHCIGEAAADDIVDLRPGSAAAGKEEPGEKLPVVYEEDMPVRFVLYFCLFLFMRKTRIC